MALAMGRADYLLLIDADMTLVRNGALPPLLADAYLLPHLGELRYAVPRLVRGDRRWWFEGATHEYLATDGPFTQEVLEALAIEHHGDGGTRAEKFERDVRLLQDAIERDPADARSTFYLAQTLREGGEPTRAIELYRRRVGLGGWDEEVFYAAYQLAVLVGHRDPDAAIPLLLEAHELRPTRAEPLYELARLSRLRRRHQAAYMFACRGALIPTPSDMLFVHRSVYDWGMRFEQAVAAYWIGHYEEALELNEGLLAEGRMPPAHASAVESNRNYCLEALGGRSDTRPFAMRLATMLPDLWHREIHLDVDPPWPQFNPSLASDETACSHGRPHSELQDRARRRVRHLRRGSNRPDGQLPRPARPRATDLVGDSDQGSLERASRLSLVRRRLGGPSIDQGRRAVACHRECAGPKSRGSRRGGPARAGWTQHPECTRSPRARTGSPREELDAVRPRRSFAPRLLMRTNRRTRMRSGDGQASGDRPTRGSSVCACAPWRLRGRPRHRRVAVRRPRGF